MFTGAFENSFKPVIATILLVARTIVFCFLVLQTAAGLGQSFDYNAGSVGLGPIYPPAGESGISIVNPAAWISISRSGPGSIYTISVQSNFVNDGITSSRTPQSELVAATLTLAKVV